MHTSSNLRRFAATAAVMAAAAGGFGALSSPAAAATSPTATLNLGLVTVTGTDADDRIGITSDATHLVVDFGFDGTIDAQFPRSQYTKVQVFAGGGNDGVSLTGTGDVPITLSGGIGSDGIGVVGSIGETGTGDSRAIVNGNAGNDRIFVAAPGPVTVQAGAGADLVEGGGAGVGRETVSLGDGNDRFLTSLNAFVGLRSDVVDGGLGQDSMEVEGTFASESVALSANAGHLIIDHDLRDRIDADNVEAVTYFGFGGLDSGDAIAVNDLSGTDVVRFTPNFSVNRESTAPNNSADTLTVRGTAGVDDITVSGSGANTTVAGLIPTVTPVFLEPQDFLLLDTLDGTDTVDSSGLQAGLVQLLVR